LSGKRRAPGPAVKRTPAAPPKSPGKGGTPRSRGQKIWRVGRWFLAAGLVLALLGVGAFVYLYQTTDLPNPNKDFETQTSFVFYSDGKTEVGKFATQNREIITLDEMPQSLQDAVVAAENQTFWTDKGIDPKGILRAAFSNAQGNATQGASTITQQYVKILYLTQEQTLTRKLNEAILSLKLQNQVSKKEILQGYLNTIYFGHGAYGAQAAAQAYFDKDAKDLDLRESAFLATVLNNPTGYDPDVRANKGAILERYHYVLDSMVKTEAITADQAEKAKRRLPVFPKMEQESTYGGQRGHMLRLVKDELHSLGFSDQQIDGGGLRVTTTFTQKAMQAAEEGVMEARPDGFSDKKLHIAAASVEPGTGALRGFYSGQDFLDSQINWAVAGGMVGSTVKPFTVATALEQGYSLKDTFDGNSPYEFPDGSTVNNEGSGADGLGNDYGAAVTMTQALEESINTAFVDMSSSMTNGPDKILHTMNEMGVPPTERDRDHPGIPMTSRDLEADSRITLGKARISPINMANAYATVAANGQRSDVHVIEKVVDPSGETVYDWKQPARDGIDEDVAADTSYAMQQVVQHGTGQAALALGRPAAGKTGTATNDKDAVSSAWFVGYTPQLSTAVMYVRGDGDDQLDGWLPSYFGADYPADTWTAIMKRDMAGLPVEDFPPPANLDGNAPEEGHDPYTPPATTQTTQESSSTTQESSSTPTPTKTPGPPSSTHTPPGQSSPTSTDSCQLLSCPTSSDTSSQGPPSTPPGQQAYREERYW
jgi:membrane peptidoglycan carboxypeptidase